MPLAARHSRAAWVAAVLAVACASSTGPRPETAKPVVEIPDDTAAKPEPEDPLPPRGEPSPDAGDHSFADYVGAWDGVVNEKLQTELVVDPSGAFRVHLPQQPHRPACDLRGRLRVDPEVLHFDVSHSTCTLETSGTTLERNILSRSEDELLVQSSDGRMTIRYLRRKPKP